MPGNDSPPIDDLHRRLASAIEGEVRFDGMTRGLYATDASIYEIPPIGVVIPRTPADVRAAVAIAAEMGVAILPRGGGTSLSGQSVGRALVIDFSRHLNRILEIDPERRLARVEPGVVLDQLNAAVKPHGLQFGPDVATSDRANLGGMIGNNSAGARSIVHGKTVDHVRELAVLLADGTAAVFGPESREARGESHEHLPPEPSPRLSLDPRLICRTVRDVIERNRDEIIARFPAVLRRVSGYNLDAFVPDCAARVPKPNSVAELDARWPDRGDFNLAKLIVGSEGTLATVTEALVHLVPLPRERGLLVLHFPALDDAMRSPARILEHRPSAVELIDGLILRLAAKNLQYRHWLDFVVGEPECLLIVEFSADDAGELARRVEACRGDLKGAPGLDHVLVATEPRLREQVWRCRKAGLPLLYGIPGARKPVAFVEDTAVPPARLPEFVRRFREVIARHGTSGAFYGHASVGCLHIRPLLDLKSGDDVRRMRAIAEEVCELVREFGGAMSGEHGDGLARSQWNERLFGPRLYEAMRQIKRAFDPQGIMNPGKVVDAEDLTHNLRYGPGYRTAPIETVLDFSREGGFAAAAEMCNGAGVCRKMTGTMCPSYMVTRDEEHTTRGRANALRLAMAGKLGSEVRGQGSGGATSYRLKATGSPRSEPEARSVRPEARGPALTSRRMYEVMDLCLMCKGCKAECPSNVDLAKLKAEFLFHYYQEHRMPLGARLMGHVAWLNRIGAAVAPLANALLASPAVAWLNEKVLGIDRRRRLPRFRRDHFRRWFAKRRVAGAKRSVPPRASGRVARATGDARLEAEARSPKPEARGPELQRPPTPTLPHKGGGERVVVPHVGGGGRVVLLDDCLTSYTEPEVNRAAVELLEHAGFEVELAGLWCCGRPLISKGLLREAQQLAARNVARLVRPVDEGAVIVGCEPSCLLTLLDEYPDLVPGEAARRVAERAVMVDGWLAEKRSAVERQGSGTSPGYGLQATGAVGSQAQAPSLKPEARSLELVLLHGHCQQKALVGTGGTRRLLELLPGVEVREVDSGCCGMAGSFGYEVGHYEVSQAIGRRVLFPAVEEHEGVVVAPGFSCRHQIAEATGRRAVHPVEFAAAKLGLSGGGDASAKRR